jgi:hypothetical protein
MAKTQRSKALPFRPAATAKPTGARRGRPPKAAADDKSLIEWTDQSRQAHVLDWRQRAHEFGLNPVEEEGPGRTHEDVAVDPDRLLYEEEPEAFRRQPVGNGEEPDADEADEELPGRPMAHEDVDLVRVYLQHIGKRRLLKKHEEQAIGERIENAQRDLLASLMAIPSAIGTLGSLAERVKSREVPAADLILLPEGGELREDQVTPVLRAFARVKRRRALMATIHEQLASERCGVRKRAELEAELQRTQEKEHRGHRGAPDPAGAARRARRRTGAHRRRVPRRRATASRRTDRALPRD